MIGANGQLLFAGEDVSAGQEVFLKNGLMEYGSIFGHGAYLGPDFTADYLHRAALIANDLNAVCSCLCCFWQFGPRICGNSGWIQQGWSWFRAQGFEYLDLGRFFQVLLTVGLAFWAILIFRGLRGRLGTEPVPGELVRCQRSAQCHIVTPKQNNNSPTTTPALLDILFA